MYHIASGIRRSDDAWTSLPKYSKKVNPRNRRDALTVIATERS